MFLDAVAPGYMMPAFPTGDGTSPSGLRSGIPMLNMTKRLRYGLRASVEMVLRGAWRGESDTPLSLAWIARHQGIPEPFLRQIFHALRKARLVETVMGKNGGYRLVRHPDRISAYDIAQALGEDTMPVPCVNHHVPCSRVRKCTTHLLWTRVEALLRDVLIQTSVSQLAFLCIRKGRTSRRRAHLLDL